ncbi:transcription-repair coupling factor (superfamily II helicase) [Methylomagnum ishizawai]|uniref:Transcription-repair-coupling factor n=1 Tax=Methylomagnum ishizawai TaxID=1760988 RepID=A0A1Y6D1N0_9GAMM|nr:transcription-repair coupling factor [Methylomagnum ishizawai]SMF94472.1 transcription-repair coupling factor (superfamily II helicase) [Methylomagnum ishizawai]
MTPASPTTPLTPTTPASTQGEGGPALWRNLLGCADALALAQAVLREKRLFLVATEDTQTAVRLEHEIAFFLGGAAPVLHFPDWETLPYDIFSPLPEIVSERLKTLAALARAGQGVLLTPVATLMQRLTPRSHVLGNTFVLKPGHRLSLEETRQRLESVGYQCVSQVLQHGEFAVRGAILDLFPMGSAVPYRIELFDEEVESIRTFDVESQRSAQKVGEINLFPAREFPFDEDAIKRFRKAFRVHFPEAASNNPLYLEVSKGIAPGGIEYYLPLFVDTTETLFDYLPKGAVVVLRGAARAAANAFHAETEARYRQRSGHIDKPPLLPATLFLDPETLEQRLSAYPRIEIDPADSSAEGTVYTCKPLPPLALDPKQKQPAAALSAFIAELQGRVLFVAETAGHREALLEQLGKAGLRPKVVESWREFLDRPEGPCLVIAPMDHGLWLAEPPLAIVTETQLSGEKVQQRRRRRRAGGHKLDQLLRNLEELDVGSPVVHQDHGVGRYLGLAKLTVGGIDTEFLALEYAGGDKLYVPVSSLHLIGRYSGADPDAAPLHKLGGEQWRKARRKALERVRDVAAELLDIHAKRAARLGFGHQTQTEEYLAFAAAFPFEETPDQESAILDCLGDMASPRPMDRVVCGDVGFGKTEVAMRAAFVAVQNGKQVAVLVPTTLLAQQHYQNFRDRFADWPIRVETVSRFVGKKQQEQALKELAEGKLDILIGTHKVLQKDVKFKDLGLVVVDEEHRFGVTQKEHFKKLRSEVDFLALTATPIPRTLNLAMSGLRDISIIATPPPNRHAIKTFVSEWDDALVQEALLREIKRGGQAYFLHNKIETMDKMARELAKLVPLARIRTAHGQMPERELENIMLDFYHQRFNVLICTTIIESGIDVPSANTIVINRADMLGLAQLHQIRGRVGRSHHRAYAYLMVPPKSLMTADAIKRLEAIEASGELGAGFMLSSHDLEIRGAGELLGDEQSGQIQEIGLTMYTEMLERAVEALQSGRQPDLDLLPHEAGPEIDLQAPALIPDDYLWDAHTRLVLYKRIANARDDEGLRALQVEMIDRFGLLPPQTKVLFAITALKLKAEKLGIRKIEAGPGGGRILFHPNPSIDPIQVIRLIQTQPKVYKLDGPDKLRFTASFDGPEAKLGFVEKLVGELAG